MLNSTLELKRICDRYHTLFGQSASSFDQTLIELVTPILDAIGNSDAPYHTVDHVLQVMAVGQLILEGKQHYDGDVSPKDWLQFMVALSCQDIGYVKELFEWDDLVHHLYYDGKSSLVKLSPRATGAALSDCHVDRSKAFAAIHLIHPHIHLENVQAMIEMTRFPIPSQSHYQNNLNYPGLCRAADLLGQICDPNYLGKLATLFQEFEESGMNQALGYVTPHNLQAHYPAFIWHMIYPYVKGSVRYLSATPEGRKAISQLYTNLCLAESDPAADEAPLAMSWQEGDESQFLPWQEAGFLFFS